MTSGGPLSLLKGESSRVSVSALFVAVSRFK